MEQVERLRAKSREQSGAGALSSWAKFCLFIKRRLKLNRYLLIIETKKGVSISASVVMVIDLIDLLWNLSMTFGPLNSLMIVLLLIETLLVVCISSVLLYAIKSEDRSDLMSILFTWLVVVAVDYVLRSSMMLSSIIISERASYTAKAIRLIVCIMMMALIAHSWQCVFTYYDENNGKITTVKITPSDDKTGGRSGAVRSAANRKQMLMMKNAGYVQELSAGNLAALSADSASNTLRAPDEDGAKMCW